jgi:hypothetical protein
MKANVKPSIVAEFDKTNFQIQLSWSYSEFNEQEPFRYLLLVSTDSKTENYYIKSELYE